MTAFNRRQFLKLAGATSLVAAMPRSLSAATPLSNRVVIIGGGFAGATAAKYLKHWDNTIDVTLVEPNATHYACILSNLVITGAISMNRINLSYDGLRNRGVKIVQAMAAAIDPVGSKVGLSNGATLDYEHLILAPGIDFIKPNPAGAQPLYAPNLPPRALKSRPETTLL
ncbi:MAG: NAD(P)/FAD-dependent oxidoreductase [Methylocaldum sp.]|nr:NAD(P)/FAD-dependent oxidoreductase [Methylocaldum sp.]